MKEKKFMRHLYLRQEFTFKRTNDKKETVIKEITRVENLLENYSLLKTIEE